MCLAAPAKVISISDNEAVVDYNGVRTTTRLDALTEPLAPGDYVLIHTGFAIRRLSTEDGEETLKLFDDLAESLRDSVGSSDNANANSPDCTDASSDENAQHSRAGGVSSSDQQAKLSSDERAQPSRVGDANPPNEEDAGSSENAKCSPASDVEKSHYSGTQ